jgi:hypothetical protein
LAYYHIKQLIIMKYGFKDRYTDYQGTDVERVFNTRFYAYAGTGTAASRQNPSRSTGTIAATNGQNQSIILGGGFHKFSVGTTSAPVNANNTMFRIIGHGMKASIVDAILYEGHHMSGGTFDGVFLKDVTVKSVVTYRLGYNGQGTYYNKYYQCEMLALPILTNTGVNIANLYDRCIFRINPSSGTVNANNSFVSATEPVTTIPTTQQHLFEACDVYLSTADILSGRTPYYFAFDRCRFRIIGEADYTELQGNTPDEMRADFVARCIAQGYNPPDNTEFGITNKFYRWVFTKDSCFESVIPKGSDIHQFEVVRGIAFGAITTRAEKIGVTTEVNVPGTFSPAFPNTGSLDYQPSGMYLPDTDDITDLHYYSAASNIVSFGQRKVISWLSITDNLPAIYGVKADSTQDIFSNSPIPPDNGNIYPGIFYVVRSTDKQPASISYNGATYSTSLNTRNNLVYGVAAASTYTTVSGNPALYQVNDELLYKTIQVRVVNKIPADIIKTGALLTGYWYIAEHDTDPNNVTDYITYNGNNYYTGAAFLVSGTTSFSVTGNIHLRRCWKDIFDYDTETVDKAFWANIQKPKWFEVVDGDPRCLLRNNHDLAHEMETDALGNYIASGHPDFYKSILGESGIPLKPMPVKGAYMQVRVVISTLNIM